MNTFKVLEIIIFISVFNWLYSLPHCMHKYILACLAHTTCPNSNLKSQTQTQTHNLIRTGSVLLISLGTRRAQIHFERGYLSWMGVSGPQHAHKRSLITRVREKVVHGFPLLGYMFVSHCVNLKLHIFLGEIRAFKILLLNFTEHNVN